MATNANVRFVPKSGTATSQSFNDAKVVVMVIVVVIVGLIVLMPFRALASLKT